MTPTTRPPFRSVGIALILGLVSGCAHLYDPVDEAILRVRCCVQSKVSWHRNRSVYRNVCYPYHFGKGFRAGYESVCQGGGSCPPTLPPREYWSVCHQSEVGHQQSVEWFNGFAEGALVAQMEGRDRFSEIVTSREATGRSCQLETEYHINSEQLTPYTGDPHDPEGPLDDDWRGPAPESSPSPALTPEGFPAPPAPPGTVTEDVGTWELPEEEQRRSIPPLPLPPLDEHELPKSDPLPPIPDIDFHVDTRPDGRPRELTPTGFLSPEQESGEQTGSRINFLLNRRH